MGVPLPGRAEKVGTEEVGWRWPLAAMLFLVVGWRAKQHADDDDGDDRRSTDGRISNKGREAAATR